MYRHGFSSYLQIYFIISQNLRKVNHFLVILIIYYDFLSNLLTCLAIYATYTITLSRIFTDASVLFRPFTCRMFPFLAVRRSQTEAQSAFFNFKGQPALLVIVNLAAALRMFFCKCCQSLFQIGVVGLHLDHAAVLVKIDSCGLFFLGKPCSHKNPHSAAKASAQIGMKEC